MKKKKKVPEQSRGTLIEAGVKLALSKHKVGLEYDHQSGDWYFVAKQEVNLSKVIRELFG